MAVALLFLLTARAAAEPSSTAPGANNFFVGTRAALPDLTGSWAATADTGNVLLTREMSLFRQQPTHAAAAAPNSVYAREVGGVPRGHCWLTPFHHYGSRRLERIELRCDGGDGGSVDVATGDSLVLAGHGWARQSATVPPHNTTIHTVHMVYMNHYDVGYTGYERPCSCRLFHCPAARPRPLCPPFAAQ